MKYWEIIADKLSANGWTWAIAAPLHSTVGVGWSRHTAVAGVAGESGKIRIGKVGMQTATFIAGIHGVTVASGLDVVVGTNGQLGTITSSERFKDEIKPMSKASEAILALQPVTFRYKH